MHKGWQRHRTQDKTIGTPAEERFDRGLYGTEYGGWGTLFRFDIPTNQLHVLYDSDAYTERIRAGKWIG
jgi:hypothetical protein